MTLRHNGGTKAIAAITGREYGSTGIVLRSSLSAGKWRIGCMWWSEWRGAFSIIADEYQCGAFQLCREPVGSARPSSRLARLNP